VLVNPAVALFLDDSASSPDDGPGNAAAVGKVRVGRIDNRVDGLLRQVALAHLDDLPGRCLVFYFKIAHLFLPYSR
jgi:hypothetical protein